jgi:hypothetical protein
MYQGQVDVISNQATWASKTYELVDEDDGTTTDLTDPLLTVDIVVTIRDDSDRSSVLATASIANGKVTIPGPGFQWQFEVSDLTSLCAGTYRLGAKVTIDGFVSDFIIGTVAVLDGNYGS